jgi:hypothetical protein
MMMEVLTVFMSEEGCHKFLFTTTTTVIIIMKKKTPWPLVRERTIPTERLPLVGDI